MTKNKRLIKKLSAHKLFYTDKTGGLEFYWKMNNFYDISVLVFDPTGLTYREFILDFTTFKAVFEYSEGREIKALPSFIDTKTVPLTATVMVEKDGYLLLKNSATKNYGASVLAKTTELAITLKRVVFTGTGSIMGVDVISLPKVGAKKLVKAVIKGFKKADIMIDLGGEL